MNLTNSPGIVIKRQRHLEQDTRSIIFLREGGKVVVVSKGTQRLASKLRVLQEPFIEAEYQLFLPTHGLFARLISGRLINSHQALRHNMDAFQTAAKCCEVIDVLFPFRAASPFVYDILRATLQSLQASPEPQFEWLNFLLHFLKSMGHGDHRPALMKWTRSEEPLRFSRDGLLSALAYLETQLEGIMPRKLKSGIFETPLTTINI